MDGSAAIERNRVALVRIVAALAAMAGFALGPDGPRDASARKAEGEPRRTLPRYLWRAVLRLLRPAESAARRLVIAAARGMTPPPPRGTCTRACRRQDPGARSPVLSREPAERAKGGVTDSSAVARLVHRSPQGEGGRAEAEGNEGGLQPSRRIALPLFDRLRRIGPHPLASRDLPRISVPGWTERLPVPVRLEPSPDDPINAARLALRLDALARALDDLPGQALRFARWQAASSRAAAAAQNVNFAEGAQNVNLAGVQPARFRRLSPLRGGPPPGGRLARNAAGTQRGKAFGHVREVDEILAHAHALALYALERPDTS